MSASASAMDVDIASTTCDKYNCGACSYCQAKMDSNNPNFYVTCPIAHKKHYKRTKRCAKCFGELDDKRPSFITPKEFIKYKKGDGFPRYITIQAKQYFKTILKGENPTDTFITELYAKGCHFKRFIDNIAENAFRFLMFANKDTLAKIAEFSDEIIDLLVMHNMLTINSYLPQIETNSIMFWWFKSGNIERLRKYKALARDDKGSAKPMIDSIIKFINSNPEYYTESNVSTLLYVFDNDVIFDNYIVDKCCANGNYDMLFRCKIMNDHVSITKLFKEHPEYLNADIINILIDSFGGIEYIGDIAAIAADYIIGKDFINTEQHDFSGRLQHLCCRYGGVKDCVFCLEKFVNCYPIDTMIRVPVNENCIYIRYIKIDGIIDTNIIKFCKLLQKVPLTGEMIESILANSCIINGLLSNGNTYLHEYIGSEIKNVLKTRA